MKVIINTYPTTPNVPHAEVGDEVIWELSHRRTYKLIRIKDNACVFTTPQVDLNGFLQNGTKPILVGVIGQVKSKGWRFEIAP